MPFGHLHQLRSTYSGHTFHHVVDVRADRAHDGVLLVRSEPFLNHDQVLLGHGDVNAAVAEVSDEFTAFAGDLNDTAADTDLD